MNRFTRITWCTLVCWGLTNSGISWAGENEMMDALVHKLVQKGVLSQEDAREIRKEVAEEAAKMAKSRGEDTKDSLKKELSGMIAKAKWSGDLRLRHESQFREPATDRQRQRFRLRYGFKTKPFDQMEVGVRLATGASGDPTSTNQSFTSVFDKKALFVDQAYAKYTPFPWLSVTGGKMDNPFSTLPEGIVWDGDVTPEGAAVQISPAGGMPIKPFLTGGAFAISELGTDSGDPGLLAGQVGADVKLPIPGWTWQPAAAYYNYTGVEAKRVTDLLSSSFGNSTDGAAAAARYRYDFDVWAFTSKIKTPPILGQPVALLGDYTRNRGASDDNSGWMAGLQVGKVTDKFGSWQTFYHYRRIEPDATLGALTDSDFGTGGTNHKGHIMGVQMGLNKYASVGLKYFRTDEVDDTRSQAAQAHNNTLQADTIIKF